MGVGEFEANLVYILSEVCRQRHSETLTSRINNKSQEPYMLFVTFKILVRWILPNSSI